PCKPTKANGGRTRNLPEHDREKWERFKAYNLRDVEAEMQIQQRLAKFPVPDFVWEEYRQDQEINDRGIGVDMEMVAQAIAMDGRSKSELSAAMQELTELENPNSVQQMKQWLSENGIETDSLDKKAVAGLLQDAPEPLKTVLTLRQQLAKSSVKKYQAMENAVCADSRAHGMFAFYGANRTGRFSGRIIQLQNLYKNTMPDLAQARELVRCGDFEALEILYDSVPEVLSELIRTAFVPQDGRKFIVADFSAIEARVLAWLAGEKWVLDVFGKGGDIYCETASRMFHCRVEKHGENAELRQKGKQAVLSCGYGGSVGALKAMGALEAGMTEDELQPLVDSWREANPNIVQLWW
ncbi:MAG: DNA polymerase, partial [Dysosmobacter sp.]|nr:DNA polymerase [Dysosmobacter sp.]